MRIERRLEKQVCPGPGRPRAGEHSPCRSRRDGRAEPLGTEGFCNQVRDGHGQPAQEPVGIRAGEAAEPAAESQESPEAFNSSTWVESEPCVPVGNRSERAYKTCRRILVRGAEVHETELAGYKYAKRPTGAGLEFRSKQGGQGTDTRGHKLGVEPIVERAREVALKVV